MMERLTGPRVCTYTYPALFKKKLQSLRALSTKDLIKEIASAKEEIDRGKLRPAVFRVVRLAVASDFNPEVYAAAKEALAGVPKSVVHERHPSDYLEKRFGICRTSPEYYLGAFFELLPRETALEIFESKFLSRYSFEYIPTNEPARILLRFSAPEKAADFVLDLSYRYPSTVRKLLTHTAGNGYIQKYADRRFEANDLLAEIWRRAPGLREIPESEIPVAELDPGLPLHLRGQQGVIQTHSTAELIDLIGKARHPDREAYLPRVTKLVAASKFDPQLTAAARAFFLKIFSGEDYGVSIAFPRFGLSRQFSPPLLLGALFELLPRQHAIVFFKKELLAGRFANFVKLQKAGRILLCFSQAAAAADFSIDLLNANFKRTRSALLSTLGARAVREYEFRRYEPVELFGEINRQLPLSIPLSAAHFPKSPDDL
jgi:hypothetical protein